MQSRVDAIVVGAGLNGSWVAKELTRGGMRVALLDAGPLLRSDAFERREHGATAFHWRDQLFRLALLLKGDRERALSSVAHQDTHQLFLARGEHPYETTAEDFNWTRVRAVGGRGHLWGRVLLRMTDADLASPGTEWPLHYADLAPYYAEVERVLELGGSPSGHSRVPDGEYVHQRSLHPLEKRFADVVAARWPERRTVVNHVAGYDHGPLSPMLQAAMDSGKLELLENRVVSHLENATRDGTDVVIVDRVTGAKERLRAPLVFLAASAFETVRILLNSRTERPPHGLGNSNGLLGTRILEHVAHIITNALPKKLRSEQPQYSHNPFHLNEEPHGFYLPPFERMVGPDGIDRPYGVQGTISTDKGLFFLGGFGEAQPHDANRLSLSEQTRDKHGIPVLSVTYNWADQDIAMWRRMRDTMSEMTAAFCKDVGVSFDQPISLRVRSLLSPQARPVPDSNHEAGGARMGLDPASSVVGPDNRLWDAPGVLVCDAACFPSLPPQNPTLTSMALALRASRLALASS